MNNAAKLLDDYLKKVIEQSEDTVLDINQLPEDFKKLGETISCLTKCISETKALAKDIAKGNLDTTLPPPQNELAAPLKTLHSSLRHLTWQTQHVAKGDYKQRVDFMGDFSNAFNFMAQQLEENHVKLLKEVEEKKAENEILSQNKTLYELVINQVVQQVVVVDAQSSKWLFTSHEEFNPQNLEDDKSLSQWINEQIKDIIDEKKSLKKEFEFIKKDKTFYYSVTIYPLYWHEQKAFAFVFTDVSKERQRLNLLKNIANYDTLTNVYNRYYGMKTLNKWIEESKSFVLCFMDIDNLKLVNDRFGHSEGDNYIICVANVLRRFADDAVLCRIGGDEFMVLCENITKAKATERLEFLRKYLLFNYASCEKPYEHSISYGIIEVNENNTLQASDLLRAADEKMYEYKFAYKIKKSKINKL